MSSRPLPNYLRRCRKRASLSQDDVAFLLGCQSGTKVSRYERFRRRPTLETALACEVIFGAPVRELFAGLYHQVERRTKQRATGLVRRLSRRLHEPSVRDKVRVLSALCEHLPEQLVANL
jgi:transcriptional regulator with XRE-family HTH domain